MNKYIKPRLVRSNGWWHCSCDSLIKGSGLSVDQAYTEWAIKFHRRTVIARTGVWNRKSANQWVREGMRYINMWIFVDGVARQIIAYCNISDTLILRG